MKFNSRVTELGSFCKSIHNSNIPKEIMLFNSSINFAWEKGGPITRSFIDKLPEEYKGDNAVFDSRVNMLMEGMYPCIPGYHQDDVPRSSITGQPSYKNMPYKSRHILGLVNAEVSPTIFAEGEVDFPEIENGRVFEEYHKMVLDKIGSGELITVKAKDRTLYEFDYQSFHSGTIAVDSGWRWFGRVSIDTDRAKIKTNIIRTQVQVYMDNLNMGW